MSSNYITRNCDISGVQYYQYDTNGRNMFFDLQRKPSLLLLKHSIWLNKRGYLWFSYRKLKDKKPTSHILAFVYPEQVKCFNSLGQLSLSAPRPEIRVYLRLIGSSNKPITSPSKMTFTKAAFFKFDENVYNHYRIYCRWTISPDWHNICLVRAIPMLCHWFCHSKRYRDSAHFLHALIVTFAKCNEQQLLQVIAVLAGTIEDILLHL